MFDSTTQQTDGQMAGGQTTLQTDTELKVVSEPFFPGKKLPGKKLIEELRRPFIATNDVSPEIQEMLNKPTKLTGQVQVDPRDYDFLQSIMLKVDQKEIDLYRPASLLNMSVYEQLSLEGKAKADFDILNLLNKIREIRKLWLAGEHDTYQILNLIHSLRLTKERLEELGGDLFII